jgi:hypothetical protein
VSVACVMHSLHSFLVSGSVVMPSYSIYRQSPVSVPALLQSHTVDCLVSGALFLRPCCLGCCYVAINPFQQIA